MEIRKIVPNIKDDEEILAEYHQFWLALFWKWCVGLVFIIAPFFFLYVFLRWGTAGSILLAALFLFGVLWTYRVYRLWRYTMLVITSVRLVKVMQLGMFDRKVSQVNFGKITDIAYRADGIWQTLFKYGSLSIQTWGEMFEMKGLRHPYDIQQVIYDMQAEMEEGDGVQEFSDADLLAVIREIRSRVGERRWRQIVEGDWELKQELIDEVSKEDEEQARAIEQFFGTEAE